MAENTWNFLACKHITPVFTSVSTWLYPCVFVFTWLPSYKDTNLIGLGAHLLQYDLVLTNYNYNGAISKYDSHSEIVELGL